MFHLLGSESNADRASTPAELDRAAIANVNHSQFLENFTSKMPRKWEFDKWDSLAVFRKTRD